MCPYHDHLASAKLLASLAAPQTYNLPVLLQLGDQLITLLDNIVVPMLCQP